MHYYIYFVKNRLWKRISLIQKACVSLTHARSHPSRIIPLTNGNPKPQSPKGSKAEAPHPTPSSWAPTMTNSNQSKPHSLSPLQTTLLGAVPRRSSRKAKTSSKSTKNSSSLSKSCRRSKMSLKRKMLLELWGV